MTAFKSYPQVVGEFTGYVLLSHAILISFTFARAIPSIIWSLMFKIMTLKELAQKFVIFLVGSVKKHDTLHNSLNL